MAVCQGALSGAALTNNTSDFDWLSVRAKLVGDRCAQLGSSTEGDIAQFMGTASVATDMLKITEKLGQEKVQYWGFSYGTVLGQYFTAMYPDKVGRVIIDGVLDGNDYHNALWDSNLVDNEAVIDSLFTFCHQAGPLKCPLYELTPSAIRDRYYRVLATVKETAVLIPLAEPPLVLTHKDLVNQIFLAAYSPLQTYPIVAVTIRAIKTANQTALTAFAPLVISPVTCNCSTSPTALPDNDYEAFSGVACSNTDVDPVPGVLREPHARRAHHRPRLVHAPPRWCYTGAFAAQNTSHPLLIVQLWFDPVSGVQARSEEDERLLEAPQGLSKAIPVFGARWSR
ncbi:hypothetical protein V8D89_013295 [Ganoderma adspersum]